MTLQRPPPLRSGATPAAAGSEFSAAGSEFPAAGSEFPVAGSELARSGGAPICGGEAIFSTTSGPPPRGHGYGGPGNQRAKL